MTDLHSNARRFIAQVAGPLRVSHPPLQELRDVMRGLLDWACSPEWAECGLPEAAVGEERLVALAVSADDGPSLYLVSDGASTSSPPHGHETWAIIAGIRGVETNHRYQLVSAAERRVVHASTVDVGPGDVLLLQSGDVHSTEVRSAAPTFHRHLYGRPLHRLARFSERCYRVG